MGTKTFNVITSLSMAVTILAALLSITGIVITGFYPGIIVLLFMPFIPIASKVYAKNILGKSNNFQKNYHTTLTIINLLVILIVLWMTFVIVIDRVFPNI